MKWRIAVFARAEGVKLYACLKSWHDGDPALKYRSTINRPDGAQIQASRKD